MNRHKDRNEYVLESITFIVSFVLLSNNTHVNGLN